MKKIFFICLITSAFISDVSAQDSLKSRVDIPPASDSTQSGFAVAFSFEHFQNFKPDNNSDRGVLNGFGIDFKYKISVHPFLLGLDYKAAYVGGGEYFLINGSLGISCRYTFYSMLPFRFYTEQKVSYGGFSTLFYKDVVSPILSLSVGVSVSKVSIGLAYSYVTNNKISANHFSVLLEFPPPLLTLFDL